MKGKGTVVISASVILIGMVLFLGLNLGFADTSVYIWDNDAIDWTTTLSNGDPIDNGTANNAYEPQLAIDSTGIVYATYRQWSGVPILSHHIYLTRCDGTDVRIWDNDTANWTTNLSDGDPIDTGTTNDAWVPQLAIDSKDVVYVTYRQFAGGNWHIFLSRYDGTDVRIWDNDTSNWTTTFANGDPIDTGTANGADEPQLAIDANDVVYVTYRQSDGAQDHIYLSRYDGTDVRIWDNDTTDWITNFAVGDPIDTGTANRAYEPQLAIDANNVVYVTYRQMGVANWCIYLSRYDGTDVRIWDNDTTDWITNFAVGDPIDTGIAGAFQPHLAIDSNDVVYVTYRQSDFFDNHIYLNRYDGTDVRIWDNDTADWITNFAVGDPIDTGTTNDADRPQLAIDANDIVYVTYLQFDGAQNHIYLSRYDGTDVRIWDNDTADWITNFAVGDPIDTGTTNDADEPRLAIDANEVVYVAYRQIAGGNWHIFLSRYDGTDVRIWDNDTTDWILTFADGDPIDTGTMNDALEPQLVIDSSEPVYVTYSQMDAMPNWHIYLSRYGAPSSSTGGSSSSSGGRCFIATAAYGSQMAPSVELLREFRDRFLLTNIVGKASVGFYCAISPPIADFIAKHNNLRRLVRVSLLPFVGISWMALHLGIVPTMVFILIFMVSMSGTTVVFIRKIRLRRQKR
jgi:hypothetical protein